ncbi:alpha/beta-hydrolase [Clavulina sp. PMI_390]|nr:alpha/beta-hydrolase [Clavulina sp. PMI_390]
MMKRVVIHGPRSWSSLAVWWFVKLFLPLIVKKPAAPAPKGPQIWELPPPRLKRSIDSGAVLLSEWKEETTGWTIPVLRAKPRESEPAKRALLYFHGGSFHLGITGSHWTWLAWLSEKLDADVYAVPYPLAPLNTAMEVIPQLVEIHKSLLKHVANQEVIWGGDSAGGVISIGLGYAVHQAGVPLPHQIIAISPGTTVLQYKPSAEIDKIRPLDSMLTPEGAAKGRRMWVGLPPDSTAPVPESVLSDASINPIVGDPVVFKDAGTQVIVTSGTWDTLHPYVYDFVEKLDKAGGPAVYIEGPEQLHVFPLTRALTREGAEAADAIVEAVLAYST